MTYSIAEETEQRGVLRVFCAACNFHLGTMRLPTIMRAMSLKGPLICPECRTRKCDYCGRMQEHKILITGQPFGEGSFKICPVCLTFGAEENAPQCEKILILYEAITLTGKEVTPGV